jgi:hypothetical protein
MRVPRESEIATARRLIVVVGVASLLAQLMVLSLDRPPSWDESIYLSQVAPDAEPLPFVPSRARGITFLAAPVLQLGGSLAQLRLFLVIASAAALIAAFRMWVPVIGFGAVAAAFLFAGAWPALFYGSEVMPNLWVALIAVAATAVLARRLADGDGRHDELVAGGLVALAALIRPLDAVVLTAALILLPIAVRRPTVPWAVLLLLGLAAGWAPWLVEMTARFGSPGEAFAAASRFGHTGHWSLFENARQYLALSDGPSIGPVTNPDIPVTGLLWLLGIAILLGLGVRAESRGNLLPSVLVPTTASVALAAEYIVFTDAQAPRFLLPGLALLTIPAGSGLVSIVGRSGDRERAGRFVAGAAAAIVLIAWAVIQLHIAERVEAAVIGQRASAERAGLRIRRLSAGNPCHVYTEGSFPIIGFAAGCRAAPLGKVLVTWKDRADHLERDGIRVFLVLHRSEALPLPEGSALLAVVPSQEGLRWFIYGTADLDRARRIPSTST